MIEESDTWDNMDLHPFLLHTEGRLMLHVRCMLLLEEYDALKELEAKLKPPEEYVQLRWDHEFSEWFSVNYSTYPLIVRFRDWVVRINIDFFKDC